MKSKPGAIFVSIASYRDDVCSTTLDSLYTMADKPDRVYVGICQQNKNEEDDDIDCVTKGYQDHPRVRIIRIPHFDAKGPTHARYLCSTLWNGEEYFLQIDSHSKFVKGWDTLCIGMLSNIKNKGLSKKPVLSHYPKEISTYDEHNYGTKNNVTRICKSFFNDRGMISFMGSEEMNSNNIPYMTPYIAGGMLFCESYFLKELPFDPNLPFLFVGEEILHSIRFYTHGWDIFTPTENIIFHEYTRKDKPKIWTDNPYYSDIPAFDKVKYYLKLVVNNDKDFNDKDFKDKDFKDKVVNYLQFNLDKYGLGKTRTLEDYYNFAGIDIINKKVYKNFCKENNIATENDILMSNEINHKKNNTEIIPNSPENIPNSPEIIPNSLKNILILILASGIISLIIYYILHFIVNY
jgi:hypothetical protein